MELVPSAPPRWRWGTKNLPALWWCGINTKVWQDERKEGGRRQLTTVLLLALASSLIPFCCVFTALCDEQHGDMFVLSLFEGKLIFWDLAYQVEEHNLFRLYAGGNPPPQTLSVSSLVFACSLWRARINSLVGRAAQMVSRVRTGATGKRPPSSWHTPCRLLDAANLATLLTVAHTHPSSRHQGHPNTICPPWHLPTPAPNPLLYSTLLISTKVRFSSRCFPRLIFFDKLSGVSSWWPPHLNYNHYETISATLRKRQTTHTIASQSSSLYAISPLCRTPRNFHGFIFTLSS